MFRRKRNFTPERRTRDYDGFRRHGDFTKEGTIRQVGDDRGWMEFILLLLSFVHNFWLVYDPFQDSRNGRNWVISVIETLRSRKEKEENI